MLQTQTVTPKLVELLDKIMTSDVFSDFVLVGGTSLALQIGHRNSIHLDFFGNVEIDEELFEKTISSFGKMIVMKKSKSILITQINGVKTDFVKYRYPLIADVTTVNGVRLASKQDIAAMKLNAIAGRGSKKDFIDLYFLLQEFSLSEMLEFYLQKYHDGSRFMVVKSLTYFEDADGDEQPQMFKDFDWQECKRYILEETKKIPF